MNKVTFWTKCSAAKTTFLYEKKVIIGLILFMEFSHVEKKKHRLLDTT